jgi:hypothetical protein
MVARNRQSTLHRADVSLPEDTVDLKRLIKTPELSNAWWRPAKPRRHSNVGSSATLYRSLKCESLRLQEIHEPTTARRWTAERLLPKYRFCSVVLVLALPRHRGYQARY